MSEKILEQKVSLTLGVGEFELSVEASEAFVKQDLQSCLEQIAEAKLFRSFMENLNPTPIDDMPDVVNESVGFDLKANNKYSMNSMINLMFGTSKVSVSKIITAAFVWLKRYDDKATPTIDEIREQFDRADSHLTPSQAKNFNRDFKILVKSGTVIQLTGGNFKLKPDILAEWTEKIANA